MTDEATPQEPQPTEVQPEAPQKKKKVYKKPEPVAEDVAALGRAVGEDLVKALNLPDRKDKKNRYKPLDLNEVGHFQAILNVKKQVAEYQENLLKESLQATFASITKIKQKTLNGVERWIDNFMKDEERLHNLTPSGAKTLLSIAYLADQMGRLDSGRATSHVAIQHASANQKPMLESAIEKLKTIDPVFDYSKMKVEELDAPKTPDEELIPRRTSEAAVDTDGTSGVDGGPRDSDDGFISPSEQRIEDPASQGPDSAS